MKVKLFAVNIIVIFLCLSVMPAMADYDTGLSIIDRNSGYFSGDGGEFTISSSGLGTTQYDPDTRNIDILGGMATSFQSFCVELNEYITSPPQYIERTIVSTTGGFGSQAVAGGIDGGSPDPLAEETAYLYTQFARGVLSSYRYTPGGDRMADAEQLQKAIWFIEDEIDSLDSGSQAEIWYNEAVAKVTSGAWSGIGNVRVLNLEDQTPGGFIKVQDMLYMTPIPGAVMLGVLGLGVAAIKLRKYA